jgi:hypothetical protein
MRCSFGSVTGNERVSSGRICRSPERRQPGKRNIPHDAMALEEAALVGDGTTLLKATGWTNQERDEGLAGRSILAKREP